MPKNRSCSAEFCREWNYIISHGGNSSDVAKSLGISKQAASCRASQLRRLGIPLLRSRKYSTDDFEAMKKAAIEAVAGTDREAEIR